MDKQIQWTKIPGADGLLFGERLKDLIVENNTTAHKVSKATGIGESKLSAFQNDADRVPLSDVIITLARYFNVSTDYLYGLTTVKTPNTKTRAVCKYTGLSERSIDALASWQKWGAFKEFAQMLDILIFDAEYQNNGHRSILLLLHYFFHFHGSAQKYLIYINGTITPAETNGTGINDILLNDRIVENAVLMEMQQALINLKETRCEFNE